MSADRELEELRADAERWRAVREVVQAHSVSMDGTSCYHLHLGRARSVEAAADNLRGAINAPDPGALRDAVMVALERFEHYAASHKAKKTADGDAKAAENLRLAEVMRRALDGGGNG